MGNVGTIPATGYESSIDQTFSTPTGTTHTLTYSVASQADILVYVNNVAQEPGVGFTVSGTTLTTDTLVSGDTLYVKYLALARQTVAPGANSITESMMKDALIADFTEVVATASDSILLGDATDSGNTKRDTIQGILDLVTSFEVGASAYRSATQSVVTSTLTKVQLNAENYDPNGDFDSTTNYEYVVPAGQGGKYLVTASINYGSGTDNYSIDAIIYKNGSIAKWGNRVKSTNGGGCNAVVACILDLAATDTIQLWCNHGLGSNTNVGNVQTQTYMDIQRVA